MTNPYRKLLDDAVSQGNRLVGSSVPNAVLETAKKDTDQLFSGFNQVCTKDEYPAVLRDGNNSRWEIDFTNKSNRIRIIFGKDGKITAVSQRKAGT